MSEDVIKVGDYIVIQKQKYKKLHKFNKPNSSVSLGRDSVNLTGIEGKPYFSVFRTIPNNKKGREYRVELVDEAVELKDEIDIKTSGTDNRNIIDDGRSQKLSAAEIADLANDATKASDIVETLISNSKTFHSKTEFSQEKYLKKKEKKYFEFIEIVKPNLRLITEIMYRLDPNKIQNIRIDTLSQIITLSNIQAKGVHLLYDSGSNGLVAAALLSAIGANTDGKLIHMHPGNMSQKQALLAMNFSEEQNHRCISVNIYSALRQYYQGNDIHEYKSIKSEAETNPLKRKIEDHDEDIENKKSKLNSQEEIVSIEKKDMVISNEEKQDGHKIDENGDETTKLSSQEEIIALEKADMEEFKDDTPQVLENTEINCTETVTLQSKPEPKKPKWHYDNITASELLKGKVDSLLIACKEDPLNIFMELLPFVNPGRPFVVYYSVAEPLQNLYVELKTNPRVAALKLTCNWMRNYQVLPERTHPEVMMNNQSGFLLSGYILK